MKLIELANQYQSNWKILAPTSRTFANLSKGSLNLAILKQNSSYLKFNIKNAVFLGLLSHNFGAN